MRLTLIAALITTGFALPTLAATPEETVKTYSDIAAAAYGDSLSTAMALQTAVRVLIDAPSDASLVAARVPYQQSEAYRFGNAVVDDWETASINRALTALGLAAAAFEGSDSLDNPGAVFQ